MQVLARQLQPHFLFNSLNALSTLILRRDTEGALAMLGSLGDFLRATVRLGDAHEQPLRAELELVSQYLAVERARLGERLTVRMEVAEGAGEVVVPVLVLQPLVENAVRHGIAAREGGGEIVIRAVWAGEVVRLEIENDGPGLPADWRERMEERVGLSNTRARLREAFGEGGRLQVEEVGPGRVRVTLEMLVRGHGATAAAVAPGGMS
jgi:LytS/YehU family sensor histidine kinase